MKSQESEIVAKLVSDISELPEAEWNACAGDDNPFLDHRFLVALEQSGSCSSERGWGPTHLIIEDDDGALAGCVPLYLKSHSRGEYVFDYGWADAFERAGGRYYPKLVAACPFTPATGARLLVRPGGDSGRVRAHLISGLIGTVNHYDISSLHVNFCLEQEWELLATHGFLKRADQQFHWFNEGYDCFDDFLDQLSSRKRKTIRRERRGALADGVSIEILTGDDIREHHWDAFFRFYLDTGSRKWGTPYLNREFFSLIGESMAARIALVMCAYDGRYIAGALNLIGGEAIYGRYWGCIEDHRFLHFEACYYQAIDFAIRHGLKRVEAGAQGPHKIARGYMPTRTHSAHYVANAGFRRAVKDYLEHERREVDAGIDYMADLGPFRKGERQSLDQSKLTGSRGRIRQVKQSSP